MSVLRLGTSYPRATWAAARLEINGGRPPRFGVGTATLTFRRASGESQAFSFTAGAGADDTYLEFSGNRIAAAEGFPGPVISRQAWPMPWADEAGVTFSFTGAGRYISASLNGSPQTPINAGSPPALPIVPARRTFTWWEIWPTALAGLWVRRVAWPAAWRLTYHSGSGSTRAVAILQTADILRVVQASDFGFDEFRAVDWHEVEAASSAPAPDPARLPTTPDAPGNPTAPGNSGSIPQSGQWVQVADEGALRWVRLAPFTCP